MSNDREVILDLWDDEPVDSSEISRESPPPEISSTPQHLLDLSEPPAHSKVSSSPQVSPTHLSQQGQSSRLSSHYQAARRERDTPKITPASPVMVVGSDVEIGARSLESSHPELALFTLSSSSETFEDSSEEMVNGRALPATRAIERVVVPTRVVTEAGYTQADSPSLQRDYPSPSPKQMHAESIGPTELISSTDFTETELTHIKRSEPMRELESEERLDILIQHDQEERDLNERLRARLERLRAKRALIFEDYDHRLQSFEMNLDQRLERLRRDQVQPTPHVETTTEPTDEVSNQSDLELSLEEELSFVESFEERSTNSITAPEPESNGPNESSSPPHLELIDQLFPQSRSHYRRASAILWSPVTSTQLSSSSLLSPAPSPASSSAQPDKASLEESPLRSWSDSTRPTEPPPEVTSPDLDEEAGADADTDELQQDQLLIEEAREALRATKMHEPAVALQRSLKKRKLLTHLVSRGVESFSLGLLSYAPPMGAFLLMRSPNHPLHFAIELNFAHWLQQADLSPHGLDHMIDAESTSRELESPSNSLSTVTAAPELIEEQTALNELKQLLEDPTVSLSSQAGWELKRHLKEIKRSLQVSEPELQDKAHVDQRERAWSAPPPQVIKSEEESERSPRPSGHASVKVRLWGLSQDPPEE